MLESGVTEQWSGRLKTQKSLLHLVGKILTSWKFRRAGVKKNDKLTPPASGKEKLPAYREENVKKREDHGAGVNFTRHHF